METSSEDEPWEDSEAWQALRALPAHQQHVVYLRVIEDLGFADVARLTGRHTGAVKMAYYRAVRRLERALGKECGTDAGIVA